MGQVSSLDFMNQLTEQERTAIAAGAQQSPALLDWLLMLAAAGTVNSDDPRLAAGVDAVVGAGLLSSDRAAQLLAYVEGPPPPAPLTVVGTRVQIGETQGDGRFWVTEIQSISDGSVQSFVYLAEPGSDANAIAAERAAQLNAQFAGG